MCETSHCDHLIGAFMNKTLAMIMAGGKGSRLSPLTCHRAKPSVPFGGRYRIIDFVLSNYSELRLSYLGSTQYMSAVLFLTSLETGICRASVKASSRHSPNAHGGALVSRNSGQHLSKSQSYSRCKTRSGRHIWRRSHLVPSIRWRLSTVKHRQI